MAKLCITKNANGCKAGSYPQRNLIGPRFAQKLHSAGAQPQSDERESNNRLDDGLR
jgi:hypothetical protein